VKRKDTGPLILVRVRDRAQIYRNGRWWRPGERLHVERRDADRLLRRESVELA